MKYFVTYKVEARCVIEVDAENLEDAMEKANSEFSNADFGMAENIDGEIVVVETEDGPDVYLAGDTNTSDKPVVTSHHAIKSMYSDGENNYPKGYCEAEITISSLDGCKRWEKTEQSENMAILKDMTKTLLEIMSTQHELVGKYLVEIVWTADGEYHDSEPAFEIVFDEEHKVVEITL